jgi:hypothetical protein
MSEDKLAGATYVPAEDDEGPLVGEFSYDAGHDRWTWSPAVFGIHGFEPHDVVPTTELIRFHAHPEDRDSVAERLEAALASPGPFALTFRLIDAQGTLRRVLLLGSSNAGDHGAVQLRGQLVDLTPLQDEIINDDLGPMVDDFREHRAVIEQAKGIVIQLFAVDADEAFDRLRACSQRINVKVRDLAQYLVLAAAADRTPDKTANSLSLVEVLEALLLSSGEPR